jgi:hypothetical protein
VLELRDGPRKSDKQTIHSHEPAQNQPTSWLILCWNTFGASSKHEQPRTHKIHHSPDLREANTFPLIVYSAPLHEAHIQMTFCLEIPKLESEIAKDWTSTTLRGYNFVCKPPIGMRFEAKL